MSHFFTKFGSPLPEAASFGGNDKTATRKKSAALDHMVCVTAQNNGGGSQQTCAQCGLTIAHLGKFCQACGAPLGEAPQEPLYKKTETADYAAGPIAFLRSGIKKCIQGFLGMCKKPFLLLPTLILSLVWLGLSVAKTQFPDSLFLSVLSFFTFAQGGMYAGLLGAIGGILGKAFLAWFVTGIFSAITSKRKPFAKKENKMKVLAGFFVAKDISGTALLLGGVGSGLIIYNFLTGNGSLENSVIGITTAMAAFRVRKNPNSFLKGFILSFGRGKLKTATADHLVAGLVLGLPLGILFSLLNIAWICYAIGGAIAIIAAILGAIGGGKKGMARATATLLIVILFLPFGAIPSFADEGAWVLKNVVQVEETETGDHVWVEDYINFQTEYQPGTGSFSYSYSGESSGDWVTGEGATATLSYDVLPERITSGQAVEIPVTAAISENNVGGGLFGAAVSVYSVPGQYTGLDDGFREGEWFLTKNGEDSFWVSAVLDGGTGEADDVLTSPAIAGGSTDDDGKYLTIIAQVTTRNGANTLYHYYDIYQYEWSGESGAANTKSEGEWMSPYEAYGIAEGDLVALDEAMSADPPVGIKFRPATGSLDEIYRMYKVESTVDQNPWVSISATGDLSPQSVYTLERGESLSFFVQSETIYEQIEDAESDVTSYGSLQADLTWEMPTTLIRDESAYRETYGNYIKVNSDFSFDAYIGEYEDEERFLNPAPYNGSHSDSWELSSSDFYGGKIEGTDNTVDGSCWFFVSLSPSLADITETGEAPGGLCFEILEVKRGDWSTAPVVGGSDGEEETEEGDDGFWNETLDLPEAIALGIAAAAAAALAAGAAGAGGGGRPPLPDSPYIERDGDDPDTIVVHSPNGSAEIYHWNEKDGKWQDHYGNELQPGKIDQAMAEQEENHRHAAWERERMAAGTDGDSMHWHKIQRTKDMQQKLKNMDDPDGMAERMADRLQKIRDDLDAGTDFDQKGYDKVRNAYGKYTKGAIAGESSLPGEYTDYQQTKDALALTAGELARGKGWKSISVRIGAAIVSGGYSEFGFEIANAATTMKDYVDQGGDSAAEAFVMASSQALINEGIGRGIGLGVKAGGYVGSKLMSPVKSVFNAAKPHVKNLLTKATVSAKSMAGNAAKAAKSALGFTDDIAKAAKNQVDDIAKAAKSQADDMAKTVASQGDDMAKATPKQTGDAANSIGKQADDLTKSAANQSDDMTKAATKKGDNAAEKAAKEANEATEKAAKEASEAAKKAEKAAKDAKKYIENQQQKAAKKAEELINEHKSKVNNSSELQKRHEAFLKGREIGAEKVKQMETAKKALEQNPNSSEAKKAYENAVKEVQKDKHAIHKLNESGDLGTNTRSDFNTIHSQKNAGADVNAKARIAKEYGVDPDKIHSVNASNKMDTKSLTETAGVAKRPKNATITDGRDSIASGADDIKVGKDPGAKTGFDTDKTYRIEETVVDKATGKTKTVMKDIPAEDVKRIYNEEYYKQWHDGKLPTKLDAKGKLVVDSEAVNGFAKDMDVAAVDMHSAEAYGMGSKDLKNAIKSDNTVKDFKDIESVSKTMEHKSTEWKNLADDTRKSGDSSLLPKAESYSEESIRQATKQYTNQVVAQTQALNTALKSNTYQIPDELATSMEILKKIGSKPGDISVAEAEAVLQSLGTNIDDVLQQSSSLMESMSKLRLK